MTDSAHPAGLHLVPPVDPGTAVMPSRRMPDGSIVFGLVEDRPPPYLGVVAVDRDDDLQNLDTIEAKA